MYIKLPETQEKESTIIDLREILCFNKNHIAFKNGSRLPSCDEWNKVLENETNRINKILKIRG